MKKYLPFLKVAGMMTLCNLLDIGSTWYSTPDLYNEANPWIVKYKLGWPGLITILLLWQVLYMFFVWLRYYKISPVNYAVRKNNCFMHIAGIYFSRTILPLKKWKYEEYKNSVKGFLYYAGYYFPIFFCVNKFLAVFTNIVTGIVYHQAVHIRKKGGWLNLSLQEDSFLYHTTTGKWILSYLEWAKKEDRQIVENHIIQCTALAVLCVFIYQEWRKACASPFDNGEEKGMAVVKNLRN